MVETIVFFIELFLSIIGISVIFIKFLDAKLLLQRVLILLCALPLPIYFILISNNQYLITSTIISYLFSLLAITNIDWKRRIYITILYQAVSIALTSSTIMIVRCFISTERINYLVDLVVNILMVLCLILIPKRYINDRIKNILLFTNFGFKVYIIVSLYFLSFSSMIISFLPQTNLYNTWYNLLIFVFVAILIVVALLFPILISNNISKNYYKKMNDIEYTQIKIQSNYYKKQLENNIELRRYKHDQKNLLIVLQSYLENNEIESAKKYIGDLSDYIKKTEGCNTGNYILDALLDDKRNRVEKKNISIDFFGSLSQSCIDDLDLCIIFGNALDNAIEACEKMDFSIHKSISVTVKQQKYLVSILITNPVIEVPVIEDNMIVTSKEDNINHGFGLYSIKKTIKKYNGDFNISCSDNLFSMKICLSI